MRSPPNSNKHALEEPPAMMICDAQVHIWGANTPERPWPARAEPHRAPLGKEELLAEMDKAGVDRVVIVPPSWEGDRNDLAIDAAKSHPDRFATMGRFDPDAPNARETIRDWKKQPGMLGMRFTFHTPVLRQPLLDGKFDWVWGEMEKLGIPAMVLFHHEYMHLADKVAERYPGLQLILDHLGLKSGKEVTRGAELRHPRQRAGARQAAQRGGQGHGHAVLRRRQDLSLQVGPSAHPAASSTLSVPSAPSGAPTGRACRAATARASPCSPRSCPG